MKNVPWKQVGFIVGALILGLLVGRFFWSPAPTQEDKTQTDKQVAQENTVWTCSMHPQVRQPKPGKCPICFMDLIPVKQGSVGKSQQEPVIHLSPRDMYLAAIQTVPVVRKPVTVNVGMVGKIDFNESLLAYITARMPGRIDRLFVNYTGMPVRKGDHMAEYYSPDLLVAQQELLLAHKALNTEGNDALIGDGLSEQRVFDSVKKKLHLWDLTDRNINDILKSGKVSDHITLYSPIAGIVIHKNALEGKYFKTGDRLFSIADLSEVWVILDAYESDLVWLRYGQNVTFTSEAYPGEVFSGRISFIDPVLDKMTRTVKVRVDANNAAGKLKPGMFVNATVKAHVAAEGKVIDPSLAGKWISPMHPEIIKDGPGKCDICGMDLVKAESLGYSVAKAGEAPLVIPATAPLITGKRAVVYVQNKEPDSFRGVEVVLGPKAGDEYIVESGLKEGELVVVNGAFKLDSALQIVAKPSMMSLKDEETKTTAKSLQVPSSFISQLDMIYNPYFKTQQALAADDFKKSLESVRSLKMMLGHIKSDNQETLQAWNKAKADLAKITDQALKSKDINALRASFANLTAVVYELTKEFGVSNNIHMVKFHCPMAFDNKGADWLQDNDKLLNPYFGEVMLRCGEKVEEISK